MISMAVTCHQSPRIIRWDSSRIMKPVGSVAMLARNQLPVSRATVVRTRSSLKNQVAMLARNQLPVSRATVVRTRSSLKNQVFEDQCEGIVCYRDERGEIICEGYDEGPRFQRKIPRTAYCYEARDADIIDLLQRNWLQITEDGASCQVEVRDILQEDLS